MAGPGRPGPSPLPGGGAWGFVARVEGAPVFRLGRTADNSAWEPGMYGAIFQANLEVARLVRERASQILAEDIVRKSQSTGLLQRAVDSPQSTYADGSRIIIGVGDYLDRVARYWRAVEEGNPGIAGLVFYGWWTSAGRGAVGSVDLEPPLEGARGGRPLVMSVGSPPGPEFGRTGLRRWYSWSVTPAAGKHYFGTAWDEVRTELTALYRRHIEQAVGPNGRTWQVPAGFHVGF